MTTSNETVAGYFAEPEDANRAIRELMDDGFELSGIGAAFHSEPPQRESGQEGPTTMAKAAAAPKAQAPGIGESGGDLPFRGGGNEGLHLAWETSNSIATSPWGLWGGWPFAGASSPGHITGSEVPPELPHDVPSELAPETSRASSHPYSCSAFENSFAGMGISADHARRLARELRRGGAVVTVKAASRAEAAERIMERNHGKIRYESAPLQMETAAEDAGQVDVFGEVHRVYPGYMPHEEVRERKVS